VQYKPHKYHSQLDDHKPTLVWNITPLLSTTDSSISQYLFKMYCQLNSKAMSATDEFILKGRKCDCQWRVSQDVFERLGKYTDTSGIVAETLIRILNSVTIQSEVFIVY
jgi:hypothetical protein